MGWTSETTCRRCGQPNPGANEGGYYEHCERECFEAMLRRMKRLEGQMAVLLAHPGSTMHAEDPKCQKCERAPEDHPAWDCKEFVP